MNQFTGDRLGTYQTNVSYFYPISKSFTMRVCKVSTLLPLFQPLRKRQRVVEIQTDLPA